MEKNGCVPDKISCLASLSSLYYVYFHHDHYSCISTGNYFRGKFQRSGLPGWEISEEVSVRDGILVIGPGGFAFMGGPVG